MILVVIFLILLIVFSLTVLYPIIFSYHYDDTKFSLICNFDYEFGRYDSVSFELTESNEFIYTTVINGKKQDYSTILSESEIKELHDFIVIDKKIFLRFRTFTRRNPPSMGDYSSIATSFLTIKHNNIIKTVGGYRSFSFAVYEEISKMLDSLQIKYFNLRESFP